MSSAGTCCWKKSIIGTNWDAEALVIFSVVALFVLTGWSVLPWLKRPEAWLITLMAAMIVSDIPQRFMLGRPYLVSISVLMTLFLLWQRHGASPPKWWMAGLMTGLFAISTFVHGVWYLWALPIAAFFFAGQFRWGLALGVSWAVGVLLGAALTGTSGGLSGASLETGAARRRDARHRPHDGDGTAAGPGDVLALIILGGLLILRQLARSERAAVDRHAGVLAALLQLGAGLQSRAFLGRLGLAGVDGFDDVRFAVAVAGAFRDGFVQTAGTGCAAWRWRLICV